MTDDLGIHAFGAYIPPLRVSREEIAAANAWVQPGFRSGARSERSTAGWDEDVITMAVDAARDCLLEVDRTQVTGIYLGTTTAPFADRLNSGVIASALDMSDSVVAQDTTGSQRAGTTAMLAAIASAANGPGLSLCAAAERRSAPAATSQEQVTGHGAAAVLVGRGPGLARLLASASLTVDFVDHFRADGQEFDYHWEERWIREEGYGKLIPRLVRRVLEKAGITAKDVTAFCLPCPMPRVDKAVAKTLGITEQSVRDSLAAGCGDTGAAHPLLMLVNALEEAKPGDRILTVGFGQGGDALLFEATAAISDYQRRGTGAKKWLTRRAACSYPRYLALNGLVKIDRGIRAEADKGTGLSAAFRHVDFLNGLVGGRCERCGTHQIPRARICVNPGCGAVDSQAPHSYAESSARVVSATADRLTYTPDPPAHYGMVDFQEGGRLMIDFTNVKADGVAVGSPMRMVFRVKDHDRQRGYTRYFWKAAPVEPMEA